MKFCAYYIYTLLMRFEGLRVQKNITYRLLETVINHNAKA